MRPFRQSVRRIEAADIGEGVLLEGGEDLRARAQLLHPRRRLAGRREVHAAIDLSDGLGKDLPANSARGESLGMIKFDADGARAMMSVAKRGSISC